MLPSLLMPRFALLFTAILLQLLTMNYGLSTAFQKPTISLSPRYSPGQSIRYQVELRTITESKSDGAVANPQGASALTLSVSAVVRLDVAAAPAPNTGGLLLTATFEKISTAVQADTPDPDAADVEASYKNLEGRSIRFTLDAAGKILSAADLPAPGQPATSTNQPWLADLIRGASAGDTTPARVSLGQSWSNDRPLPASPIAGLAIRTTSTYVRDEPCGSISSPQQPTTPPAASLPDETCAVILTQFTTTQRTPRGADPTPPEYKARGLRTSGTWSATGESLTYISLRTGLTWSVTQSGEEQMDFTVAALPLPQPPDDSAATPPAKSPPRPPAKSSTKESPVDHPTMRYAGRVRTSSSLTLLP